MALTKEQLTESIRNHCGLPRGQSTKVLESLLEIIKSTLESGEDVLISGFGKFCVKEKKNRRGRNPQTGESLMVGARRVVLFKCSPVLRDRINGVG
jgi:integration host factor subunit alpha